MSRRARAAPLSLVCVAAMSACATLATPGGQPEGTPHNGTGPFRDLDRQETMTPAAGALFLPEESMDSAMVARDGSLFYGSALPLPPEPPPDAGAIDDTGPASDVGLARIDAGSDAGRPAFLAPRWDRHRPRRISRSPARPGNPGFERGQEVLVATQAWEQGWVSDPWALIGNDGQTLLYYASGGGIGVALAPTPEGPYAARDAPILAASAVGVPRRPSVVDTGSLAAGSHRYLMFFEVAGAIHTAGSNDGIAFEPIGPVRLMPMPARDERDGVEVEVGGPGAVVVTTPAGRSFVRLYYESRRSNGQTLLTLAASPDGASFETFGRPVVLERNRRFPAPFALDDRVSLLYQWMTRDATASSSQIVVGVAPAGVRFAPQEN